MRVLCVWPLRMPLVSRLSCSWCVPYLPNYIYNSVTSGIKLFISMNLWASVVTVVVSRNFMCAHYLTVVLCNILQYIAQATILLLYTM